MGEKASVAGPSAKGEELNYVQGPPGEELRRPGSTVLANDAPMIDGFAPGVALLQPGAPTVRRQSLGSVEALARLWGVFAERVVHLAVEHVLVGRLVDAVADGLQHDGDPPIEGGQRLRPVVVPEQRLEGGGAQQAALEHGRQDGQLVVERLAEAAPMIEVDRERVVAEDLERLVVVPVHVAGKEVEHAHVHQIEQPAALVVRRDVAHHRAVVSVRFPLRLPALVIRAAPRMSPHLALRVVLRGQEGGERALERVRVAADRIIRRRHEERLQQHVVTDLVDLGGDVKDSPGHRHRPPEAEQPVQVERGYLGRVSLVVGEIEVVRIGSLIMSSITAFTSGSVAPYSSRLEMRSWKRSRLDAFWPSFRSSRSPSVGFASPSSSSVPYTSSRTMIFSNGSGRLRLRGATTSAVRSLKRSWGGAAVVADRDG
uniref:Uncharacterized protein n=1 Tax=Anopheles atroparvus TaxID=41427 RepID=A0A182IR36_ANOAO